MSRIEIQARDGGCDRASNIETMIDGVKYWPTSGDYIYSCNTTFIAFIDSTYISRFKVAGNTIYLNDALYWNGSTPPPPPCTGEGCGTGDNNIIIILGLVVFFTFLFKELKK
jgi:hypothetical protein